VLQTKVLMKKSNQADQKSMESQRAANQRFQNIPELCKESVAGRRNKDLSRFPKTKIILYEILMIM